MAEVWSRAAGAGGAGPAATVSDYAGFVAATEARRELQARNSLHGGFWIRVGAYVIDWLVLLLPSVALERTLGPQGLLAGLVGTWLYFSLMESSAGQATLGKLACGLVITDTSGRRITFARATVRYLAKIVSGLTLGLGYLLVGLTPRKRGLHDLVAGTLVLRR